MAWRRFLTCILVLLLGVVGARAELNLPRISATADQYRQTLSERPRTDLSAAALLRGLREAEQAGDAAAIVGLGEDLVGLGPHSFRSWMRLSRAHLEVYLRAAEDESAALPADLAALAAAYSAHRLAAGRAEAMEALLAMATVMRHRVARRREAYDQANETLADARQRLDKVESPLARDDNVRLDPDSPAGLLTRLRENRDRAEELREIAVDSLDAVYADLDVVYGEMARVSRAVDPDRLKAGDARAADFHSVDNDFRYSFEERLAKACMAFSDAPEPSGEDLNKWIRVEEQASRRQVRDIAFQVAGKDLCILGLKPGHRYTVVFAKGFPGETGGELGYDASYPLDIADLPERVRFAGEGFLLPTSGAGEISMTATNLERVDLDLYRITDRSLHRPIALGEMTDRLSARRHCEFANFLAEKLWSGMADFGRRNVARNEPARAFVPVRDLLAQRRAWLAGMLGADAAIDRPLVSGPRPVELPGSTPARLTGEFHADVARFEQAAGAGAPAHGVYVLVARRGTAEVGDEALRQGFSCEMDQPEDSEGVDAQWFVNTDIGLTFYEGAETLTVQARSLSGGHALADVDLELVSAGNQVLAAGRTNDAGYASFPRSLSRGTRANALIAIFASKQEDFSFIRFGRQRLDLSRLDVAGQRVAGGYAAFLYTDRGIYQPGEAIEALLQVRNADGSVPVVMPELEIRLEADDRSLYQDDIDVAEWRLGTVARSVEIRAGVRLGPANLAVVNKADGTVLAEKVVTVSPIRPDRAELDFGPDPGPWRATSTDGARVDIVGAVTARYLFARGASAGGAAAGLRAEIEVKIRAAQTVAGNCYRDLQFGRFDQSVVPVLERAVMRTDDAGRLAVRFDQLRLPDGARPLEAAIAVTLYDEVGPVAAGSRTVAVTGSAQRWLGLSREPALKATAIPGRFDLELEFAAATADGEGAPVSAMQVELVREQENYLWVRDENNVWQSVYEPSRPVIDRRTVRRNDGFEPAGRRAEGCGAAVYRAVLAKGLAAGRYILTLTDPENGAVASTRFVAGETAIEADSLEPNLFTLTADKRAYRPGEQIGFTATAPFDGVLQILFANDEIVDWGPSVEVTDGRAEFTVAARPEWRGKSFYALATVYRSRADGSRALGPGRAIGATFIEVRGDRREFEVGLRLDPRLELTGLRPDDDLDVEICLTGPDGACLAEPPANAYAVAYLVDRGILNMTRHHDVLPDPAGVFFGKHKLGLRVMDNYGQLLLKEGGDRPNRLVLSNYTADHILARSSGIVRLVDGRAKLSFSDFNIQSGQVSLMVFAWSADYANAASLDVRLASPVIADLSLPRTLYGGDRAVVPLRLQNRDFFHQGDYELQIVPADGVAVTSVANAGGGSLRAAAAQRFLIDLPEREWRTLYLTMDVAGDRSPGPADLRVALKPVTDAVIVDGAARRWSHRWRFEVAAAALPAVQTVTFPLPPGGAQVDVGRLAEGLARNFDPTGLTVSFAVSDRGSEPVQIARSGPTAAEQNFNRVMARGLLQLNDVLGTDQRAAIDELRRTLESLQSLQRQDGTFVPYRTDGEFTGAELGFRQLDNGIEFKDGLFQVASAADFLLRARRFVAVQDRVVQSSLGYLEQKIATLHNDPQLYRLSDRPYLCASGPLYGLLVLLLADQTVDKTWIDAVLECDQVDPLQRALLAAVASGYGYADRSGVILARLGRDLRDLQQVRDDLRIAMTLNFVAEADAQGQFADLLEAKLSDLARSGPVSADQVAAWLAKARRRLDENGAGTPAPSRPVLRFENADTGVFALNGPGVWRSRPLPIDRVRSPPILVSNVGQAGTRGHLTLEGIPADPDSRPLLPDGSLRRRLFDAETGREISADGPLTLTHGQRVIVVVEAGSEAVASLGGGDPSGTDSGALLYAELVPSAFSILSTNAFASVRLGENGEFGRLQAVGDLRTLTHAGNRLVAIVVPQSRRRDPDAVGADAPEDEGIEFRLAYLARVAMAGEFAVPGAMLEPIDPPVLTLHGRPATLSVRLEP